MKMGVKFSIVQVSADVGCGHEARSRTLAFRSHDFIGRVLISLPASLIGGAELFFLLIYDVFAFIDPFICLAAHFIGSSADVVAALFRARTDSIPSLAAGTRRVENSGQRSQAQSRKKPHETAATISIRHDKSSSHCL